MGTARHRRAGRGKESSSSEALGHLSLSIMALPAIMGKSPSGSYGDPSEMIAIRIHLTFTTGAPFPHLEGAN